jgi:hypothetical protein
MTWLCQYNFHTKIQTPAFPALISRRLSLRFAPLVHSARAISRIDKYKNTDPGISGTNLAHNIAFHFDRRCNIER